MVFNMHWKIVSKVSLISGCTKGSLLFRLIVALSAHIVQLSMIYWICLQYRL